MLGPICCRAFVYTNCYWNFDKLPRTIRTRLLSTIRNIFQVHKMHYGCGAFYSVHTCTQFNPIFSTSFGLVTFTCAKYRIFVSFFFFPKTLFASFLHNPCLQFLYPTNFLVRECFSLLVMFWMYNVSTINQM